VEAPEKVEAPEEEDTSPFVQKLRDLEAFSKAEMAAWDPIYLGQVPNEAAGSSVPGTKRKGKILLSSIQALLISLLPLKSISTLATMTMIRATKTVMMWCLH
jgi:hypothetical protein